MSADAKGPAYHRLEAGDPAPWFSQRTGAEPALRHGCDRRALDRARLLSAAPATRPGGRRSTTSSPTAISSTTSTSPSSAYRSIRATRARAGSPTRCPASATSSTSTCRCRGSTAPSRSMPSRAGATSRSAGPSSCSTRRCASAPSSPSRACTRLFDLRRGAAAARPVTPASSCQAPVLFLPNVFEPEFCRQLIGLYEKHGGERIRLHARGRRQDRRDPGPRATSGAATTCIEDEDADQADPARASTAASCRRS